MKRLAKALANAAALVLVLPAYLALRAAAILSSEARAFPGWSQVFSLLPGLSGAYLRRAFYRLALPRCGPNAHIEFGTVLSHPTARIGDRVYVGLFCVLGDVTLEEDVLLGSNVSIMNGRRQHGIDRLDVPIREQAGEWPRITVGCDTWIGDRSVVMADIGRHCVIGAGSVVIDPIPDYAVAAGAPARVLRYRTASARRDLAF